jgi:hypothetical protein
MARTLLGDKRAATATLRTIASKYPELRDDLLPIADMLNMDADLIALGHAVDQHGSLEMAALMGEPRVHPSESG